MSLPGQRCVVAMLAVFLGLSVLAAGCSARPISAPQPAPGPEPGSRLPGVEAEGNFVLYVGNQSLDRSRVDITVEIDGDAVVDEDFAGENQHSWRRYAVELARGEHTLVATSSKGEAAFEQSFTVAGDHWAALEYWYATGAGGAPWDPQFSWRIQDTPIQFQ